MNRMWKIGVGVGVAAFLILIAVVVAVIVYCRLRRNRAVLRNRHTVRTNGQVISTKTRTVEAQFNYRKSQNPFSSSAGDRNNDSLQAVQAGQGENDVALAYPPPVGVPPPALAHA